MVQVVDYKKCKNKNDEEFLSEDLRFDLNSALSGIERQINKGKKKNNSKWATLPGGCLPSKATINLSRGYINI